MKKLTALLCVLVMLCALLPAAVAEVIPDPIELISRTYEQYVDLRAYLPKEENKAEEKKEEEPEIVYAGRLTELYPAKSSVSMSENGVVIIPPMFSGVIAAELSVKAGEAQPLIYDFLIWVYASAPSIKSVVSKERNTVTLSWTTIHNASYYEVEYSQDSKFATYDVKKCDSTSTTLKNLDPAKVYYFRVHAVVTIDKDWNLSGKDSKTAQVKVYPRVLVTSFGISIQGVYGNHDGRSYTIKKGKQIKVSPYAIRPKNATMKTVKWESTDKAVATVSRYGVVKAVGRGSSLITATARDGSGVFASFTLIVK